jgi:pimeloyl-ACP methyl ester carboxylesterase
VRVLFDYFFRGTLPGDALHVPADLDWETEAFPAIAGALAARPDLLVEMASVEQSGLSTMGPDLAEALISALWFHHHGADDLLGRTKGASPFDNTATEYAGSLDDEKLNAGVQRISSAKRGEKFADRWFEPTGRLSVPTLMLHTSRDPVVPVAHEAAYAAAADAAGSSAMLVQRTVDAFGHCAFSAADTFGAFQDLVLWAEYGVKPAP